MHAGQATPKATPLPPPIPHTTPLITPLFWPDLGGKLFCQAKVWTKSCCVCCKRQRSGGKKYIKTYKTTRQRNNVKPQSQMQLKPQHSLGRRGFPRAEKEKIYIYMGSFNLWQDHSAAANYCAHQVSWCPAPLLFSAFIPLHFMPYPLAIYASTYLAEEHETNSKNGRWA